MNPLVPTALDGAMMVGSLGALVLTLAAFISLVRAGTSSGWRFLAWALAVLFIPIVGPLAWLVLRRRERSSARINGTVDL